MKVTIEGTVHELIEPDRMTNHEIMAIEKETGQPVSEWARMSMGVITGMVWATLRRDNPKLKYRDVSFTMEDIEEEDADEEGEEEGKDEEVAS